MANPPTLEKMMKDFHSKLGSEKLKWLMSQFNGTKTLADMFTFLWDFEDTQDSLKPLLLPSGKSEEAAEIYLQEGDKYFKEKRLSKALEQYTFGIMNAPHPPVSLKGSGQDKLILEADPFQSDEVGVPILLATAYAKRSAVLLELEQIEEGINDINLALSNGYPDDKGDLKCKALKYSHSNNNTVENSLSAQKISTFRRVHKIPDITDPHPSLPSLCKKVKMVYTESKGKHIIAERDISPGEIIGVERSISSCLDTANLPSYCSACYKNCLAPLPCPDCSMVVFCSESCRTEGLSGDHWLECRLLPTMVAMGIQPVLNVSFKLLKRYSCSQWRSNIYNMEDLNSGGLPKETGGKRLRDFDAVLHLVTNKRLRHNGDLYVKCVVALILTKLLEQTGRYFTNNNEEPLPPTREDLIFTGQLLFSHLLKVSCNGFSLLEFQSSGKLSDMKKKIIGNGIFPMLCLFNHSCNPNTEPYSYGRFQVVRASRPIAAGSEVTEGYCRGFYLKSKAGRQESLMKIFQFQCTCEACEESWPTYPELPNTLLFECIDCLSPVNDMAPMCMKCFLDYERRDYETHKQILIDEWWERVKKVRMAFVNSQTIASKMMAGDIATELDLQIICEAIALLEKYVPFPCQPLWDAHDALDLYFHQEREKAFLFQ